jgi:hypothetical protein
MYASRKIVKIQIAPDQSMRRRLKRQCPTAAEKEAMLKDVHLIEAALAADKIVASLDDEARRLFNVAELSTVVWVNPVAHHEDCLTWLADGAEPVERWLLSGH